VICYDPEGVERACIELPSRHPTSCCFGGENLDILYITSARHGLEEPGELDGALFVCECGGRGGQVYRFTTGGLRGRGGQG
jgi:sugar lactone lactonase YvrE